MDWFECGLVAARSMLKLYAIKLYRNADDAEDAVQRTMLRALTNRHSFERGTNLSAWLVTILKNDAKSLWKRKDSDTVYVDTLTDDQMAAGDPERILIVRESLSKLGEIRNQKFAHAALMFGLGLDFRQIAEEQNAPEITVRVRARRGRAALAELSGWGPHEAYA